MNRILSVLLVTVAAASLGAADTVESDRWLVGTLDGQPLANLHVTVVRHADGSRTSSVESHLELRRKMGGMDLVLRQHEANVYREDAAGALASFTLDQEKSGKRITAEGTVEAGAVQVRMRRGDRVAEERIALPAGVRLLGEQGGQRAFAQAQLEPGASLTAHNVVLLGGTVRLVAITATLVERLTEPAGAGRFRLVIDAMPLLPMQADLGRDGDLLAMQMVFGPLRIAFAPAAGPARLGGAALAMTGLVTAQGPPPAPAGPVRYRLPPAALAAMPRDAFQREVAGLLVVDPASPVADLAAGEAEALLGPAPQIETQAPELRTWTDEVLRGVPAGSATRAEALRVAVRGHLAGDATPGDLSALEAWKVRKGDCSEHANLLCAALRIAGIPARVELGFVYAGALGGWGGHAWVSAYDRESRRWLHLDAAYPGISRGCYLRTGSPGGASLDGGVSTLLGGTVEVVGG